MSWSDYLWLVFFCSFCEASPILSGLVSEATPTSCSIGSPLFRIQACVRFMPSLCRLPQKHYAQVAPSAHPKGDRLPPVSVTSNVFRHVINRFTFVHLPYTYLMPSYGTFSSNVQHQTFTAFSTLEQFADCPCETVCGGPSSILDTTNK